MVGHAARRISLREVLPLGVAVLVALAVVAGSGSAASSATGLVAAYAFDEGSGTTVADASGNGNAGTISNATWSTSGKFGKALSFNGTNARVNIPDATSLHLTSGMTLEAWVNPSVAPTGWRDIVYKGNDNYFLEASGTGNKPAGGITAGTGATAFGTTQLTAATWVHLATTYDGSNLRFYLNGTLITTVAHTGAITTSTNQLQIGGDSLFSSQYFAGLIDEVRVYNTALTAAQIQTDMNTAIGGGGSGDTTPPSAPGTLTATAASSSQINLSWGAATDNVGVTGYQIERCQGSGCSNFAQITTTAGTTFNDTGLSASTSYSYRVRATDAANNTGPYSNTSTTSTLSGGGDTTPPSAPGTLTATAASSSQINLSWGAATDNVGVTGYQVERCQGSGCSNFAQITTTAGTTFSNTGLSASTSYSYRVRATDAAANTGPYSNTATATTQSGGGGPTGLVAAYAFDEGSGTTVADASGNGSTGTISNATWSTSGKFGKALSFNGTNAKVSVPNKSSLQLSGAMTLEAWVNPTSVTSKWRDVIYKGNDTYYLEATSTSGGAPAAGGTFAGAGTTTFGTTALTANGWAHVAATYDGTTVRLYVNGTQVSSKAVTGAITSSTNALEIGGDSLYSSQYFAGLIDEVRVYNTALTAAQIQTDMNTAIGGGGSGDTTPPSAPGTLTATAASSSQINLSWGAATDNVGVTGYQIERCQGSGCSNFAQITTTAGTTFNDTGLSASTSYSYRVRATDAANNTGPYSNTSTATTQAGSGGGPTGLVAAYAFDEGTGTTVADSSGNGITGTISNATWATTAKFGKALTFNGTNARVNIPDASQLHLTSAMTLEAWVNPTAAPTGWRDVIYKGNDNYYLEASGSSSKPVAGLIGGGTYGEATGTSQLAAGSWTHLAATYDGSNVRLYVNGTLVGTTAHTGAITTSTNQLSIGGDSIYGQYFSGIIDEVRIYNTALTAAQIQTDMATAVAGGAPPNNDPSVVGSWSQPDSLPIIPIHVSELTNGKLLIFDSGTDSATNPRVWDPTNNTYTQVPYNNTADLFCAAMTPLSDGRIVISGGHNVGYVGITNTTIFNSSNNTWTDQGQMAQARWYPTTVRLPDGRILVESGAINCSDCVDPNAAHNGIADKTEIFDPATGTWTTLPVPSMRLPLYPHLYVLPDGRIFVAAAHADAIQSQVLDLTNNTWTPIGSVLQGGSSIEYAPGKIIKSGSARNPDYPTADAAATTYVIDMNQANPNWRQVASMAYPRTQHQLTMLPDGTVLATGGATNSDVYNQGLAVYPAELWDPTTETWRTLASGSVPRLYHSSAILLPDGRVSVQGGGHPGTFGIPEYRHELFSPPYLFKGARPTISSVPSSATYGQSFFVSTPDAASITKVTLIAQPTVTHSLNMNPGFLSLSFTQGSGGLNVTAPLNANLATPGKYMLFLVNSNGVPSVASWIGVGSSGSPATFAGATTRATASSSDTATPADNGWSKTFDNPFASLTFPTLASISASTSKTGSQADARRAAIFALLCPLGLHQEGLPGTKGPSLKTPLQPRSGAP